MNKIAIESVEKYANRIKESAKTIKASFDEQERQLHEASCFDEASSLVSDAVNSLEFVLSHVSTKDVINRFCVIPQQLNSRFSQEKQLDGLIFDKIDTPASQDFTIKGQIYSMNKSSIIAKLHNKDAVKVNLNQAILYKTPNANFFVVECNLNGITAKPTCQKDASDFYNAASVKIAGSEVFLVYA